VNGAAPPSTSTPRFERRFGWALAAITLVGLTIRLVFILRTRQYVDFGGDARFYHLGANLLADGKGFISPLFPHQTRQAADHPPLYIVWLAIPSVFGFQSQLSHLVWSAVLGTGTVAVIGLTGREIGGSRLGLIAAGLAAVYPNLWVPDGSLMAETVAMFTMALALFWAYRYWHRPRGVTLALVGVATGLGALSRSELILLVPLVVIPLAVLTPGVERAVRWRSVLAGVLAAGLVIAPWAIFNFSRFDRPEVLSTQFGPTVAAANCDDIWHGSLKSYYSIACYVRVNRTVPRGADQSVQDAVHRDAAGRYVRDHLDELPGVVAARAAAIVGLYHPDQQIRIDGFFEGRGMTVARAAMYSFYAMALLAIVGGFVLRRRRAVPLFPLLAGPIAVLFTAVTIYASTRFRSTAEVSLCLLAAIAVEAIGVAISRRRARPPVETVSSASAPDRTGASTA